MEGPRPLFEHELKDLVQFLSTHLRPTSPWSIADEYPLAINDSNLNNVRIIRDADTFLSAAVMKTLIIKTPIAIFKVAAIGSVVTNPEHRNQGLSAKVLEDCLNQAKAHGCDFAILWTNLYDFYRKIGFELAGTEICLELPTSFASKPTSPLRFVNSNKIDPAALLKLYMHHTTGSVRTVEEVRRYLQIPNSHVFTAWDQENRLQAYAIEGKGADLGGYIHEWGGGVSKIVPLLQFASQELKRPLHVISPANSVNLIQQLESLGARKTEGVLGMIKLLNVPNFLTKIKKYVRAKGIEQVVIEPRGDKFYLGYKENIFSTDSTADLVKLIFGPVKASDLAPFDQETVKVFEELFPIPMWIWGWDSI